MEEISVLARMEEFTKWNIAGFFMRLEVHPILARGRTPTKFLYEIPNPPVF